MLKDEIIAALNELFVKFKVPMKIKDLFLYRPVFHEVPFEDFEPINEANRLTSCDPLCIELDYECDGYIFSYHMECSNKKGIFRIKEKWLKHSDIFPRDTKGIEVNEKDITRKSRIDVFSWVLLRQLGLLARDTH
ncbi:hypothetical protein MUO83_02200 [Candidatus Bathyarchaeota archaeon]|nr:hypothetical protein [Candidatus Bathyarchaeota archaeon]